MSTDKSSNLRPATERRAHKRVRPARPPNARLKLVTRLFRAATKRLDFVDRAQARARSNGKVRFG